MKPREDRMLAEPNLLNLLTAASKQNASLPAHVGGGWWGRCWGLRIVSGLGWDGID